MTLEQNEANFSKLLGSLPKPYDLSKFKKPRYAYADHIEYDDKYHTYTNTLNNKRYISVSTILDTYTPKFEPNKYNTKNTMEKNGITYVQTLDYWKRLNEVSTNRGSFIHYCIEELLDGKKLTEVREEFGVEKGSEVDKYLRYVYDLTVGIHQQKVTTLAKKEKPKDFSNLKNSVVYCEPMFYSDEYKIAGRSDLVVVNPDCTVDIIDWKTNNGKELTYEGYGGKKLLAPLDEVNGGKLSIYQLQLSIYAYLFTLKNPDFSVRNLTIHHFTEGTSKEINLTYDYILVKKLLTHHAGL